MFSTLTRTALLQTNSISRWTCQLSRNTTPLYTFNKPTFQTFSTTKTLATPTIQQLLRKPRRSNPMKTLFKKLDHCPQKKGTVIKVQEMTPKKPNSAKRKIARVKLSNGHQIITHLPGVGHNLQPHSIVLVRGGKCQDLIGVRYKPIRGKYDFGPVAGRMTRRSKYGVKLK